MTPPDGAAGSRIEEMLGLGAGDGKGPHIWRTLGYHRVDWRHGETTLQWRAGPEYCFPTAGGPVVQGGMVTALLDAAMGGACWTVLDSDEAFLTADLRVEFLRSSRPGPLRARGQVVRRARRAVFCAAELFDDGGVLLASSRCTQVVLPAVSRGGSDDPRPSDGSPPSDARG